MPRLPYRTRLFLVRAVNVVRPRPRLVPLEIEDVLASSAAADVVGRFGALLGASAPELHWRDAPMLKNPLDLWAIVELIQDLRPAAIVETGTHHGASAAFYADISRALGLDCTVVTVDVNPKWHVEPSDHGIVSLVGLSTDSRVLADVQRHVSGRGGHVLVLLDSDHGEENVARELELYSPLVTAGSYLVVEDTSAPGAHAAVGAFLARNEQFVADRARERFLLTSQPGGWLRRVSAAS
jgi:cephalosporin hydroxylase